MVNHHPDQQHQRLLDFSGRTVVITGTASGIGAATLELLLAAGADVHALDVAYPKPRSGARQRAAINGQPVTTYRCDLSSKPSIDETLRALPESVDVVMNCAGLPNGGRFDGKTVMIVNWFALRYLTESLLDRMGAGSSVVHVASTAGRAWSERLELHRELMAAETLEEGLDWLATNRQRCGDGYVVSKEAVQYYTLWRAVQLLPRGVRMNSLCPGITQTGLVDDFRRGMGDELIDHAAAVAGRFAKPSEMAPTMLFLADEAAASYLNGVNLNVDHGTGAARMTDQSDPERIWGAR